MGLSFKNVFNRYQVSIYDMLAALSLNIYKKVRLLTVKLKPVSGYEYFVLDLDQESYNIQRSSTSMPMGNNPISNKEEDGYINLKYIDFFDYLPKENIDDFKKSLRRYAKRNKISKFGRYLSIDDLRRSLTWAILIICLHTPI